MKDLQRISSSANNLRKLKSGFIQDGAWFIDKVLARRVDISKCILVSGFWRSGTTWLQQVLASRVRAKTIFEPLDPTAVSQQSESPYTGHKAGTLAADHCFLPYNASANASYFYLGGYLEKAFRADLRGRWVRRARRSLAESFRNIVILKSVRSQFILQSIHQTFGVPIIHIYRDPRAVAASILRNNWGGSWLGEISLKSQCLQVGDGREAFFKQWSSEIEDYENRDSLARIMAYWALTEQFVQKTFSDSDSGIQLVSYEELLVNPEQKTSELLRGFDVDIQNFEKTVSNTPSPTSYSNRVVVNRNHLISGWKSELDEHQNRVVIETVSDFGMATRLSLV